MTALETAQLRLTDFDHLHQTSLAKTLEFLSVASMSTVTTLQLRLIFSPTSPFYPEDSVAPDPSPLDDLPDMAGTWRTQEP